MFMVNGSIHQRMWTDKIQHGIRQTCRIIDTGARPWFGYFWLQYRQPGRIRSGLLLKLTCEKWNDNLYTLSLSTYSIQYYQQMHHEFRWYRNCTLPNQPVRLCSSWMLHRISSYPLAADKRLVFHWNKMEIHPICYSLISPSNRWPSFGLKYFCRPYPFCIPERYVNKPLCHNLCIQQLSHGRKSTRSHRCQTNRQNLVLQINGATKKKTVCVNERIVYRAQLHRKHINKLYTIMCMRAGYPVCWHREIGRYVGKCKVMES